MDRPIPDAPPCRALEAGIALAEPIHVRGQFDGYPVEPSQVCRAVNPWRDPPRRNRSKWPNGIPG
jgi:hypothetical protein